MATKRETELDAKTTIVDADSIRILNSADSSDSETITYANFKTQLTADGIGGSDPSPHDFAGSGTITDSDGYTHIINSATGTITLPTLADNYNRIITFVRDVADSTTSLIIDGEGAETIAGATVQYLYGQYATMTLMASQGAGEWVFVGKPFDPYIFSSSSTSVTQQASPVSGTYYNSISTTLSPGEYEVEYFGNMFAAFSSVSATNGIALFTTLATSASGVDSSTRLRFQLNDSPATFRRYNLYFKKKTTLSVSSTTTYYLNYMISNTGSTCSAVGLDGSAGGETYISFRRSF